jgi:energy-coupling factor transporter ATP-binding protein EcfA2
MDPKSISILAVIHRSLENGIRSGKATIPRDWLKNRKLSIETTGAVFNSGQIHLQKPEKFKLDLLEIGFLTKRSIKSRTGKDSYLIFGNYAILFPFRNELGEVVNYFALGIKNPKKSYFNNEGVYPRHPKSNTNRIYLVNSVLDSTAILESGVLDQKEAVIALKDGEFTEDILNAILSNPQLKELICIGPIELASIWEEISKSFPGIAIDRVELPAGLSLHDQYLEKEKSVFSDFIQNSNQGIGLTQIRGIEVIHEHKLLFRGDCYNYYVLGQLSQDLGCMKVTLVIEDICSARRHRAKLDLFEPEAMRKLAEQLGEYSDSEKVTAELNLFTDNLEIYRENQIIVPKTSLSNGRTYLLLPPEKRKACIDFLKQPDLMNTLDRLIEESGVVGEFNTRNLLFSIATSYKMGDPLHALVHGSSGSGKSHLINGIGALMPSEDVISMTRITSKSLYHYNEEDLIDKLIIIQDYDGLDEQAEFAFRELQSAGHVTSSITQKDKQGNLKATVKRVKSRFASLLATTKEVYLDNISRSVLVGIDESSTQTQRIIEYQNRKLAGLIDANKELLARQFVQDCIRTLEQREVINQYAEKVNLPNEARMLRRLNNHYQSLVRVITILHQYQRASDEKGRLIAEPQDLQIACDLLFDSFMLKIDDLDSTVRQFFEDLKFYIKSKNREFTRREIRNALHLNKTQCFRYIDDLIKLEYIRKTGGHSNKGFKYKISCWDDMESLRNQLKERMITQLKSI